MADEKRGKPKAAPKNNRTTAGRFSYMLRDLKKIKEELIGNDVSDKDLELQGMTDEWQRNKYRATKLLSEITQQVNAMQQTLKERGGQRDAEIIGQRAALSKDLKQVDIIQANLFKIWEKDVKKNKMEPKQLEERKKYLDLLSAQSNKLRDLVSGVRPSAQQQAATRAINENADRRAKRAAAREAQRNARQATRAARRAQGGGSSVDDVEMDDMEKQPVSAQEQKFYMEVQQNDKKMDELLDVISAGLKNLQEMATDMGNHLDTQAQMLDELSNKMDDTIDKYGIANERLKQLLEENTGGVETWCPIIILVVILLAVIGYLFTIA